MTDICRRMSSRSFLYYISNMCFFQSSSLSSLPNLGKLVGFVVLGWLVDWIIAKGYRTSTVRKLVFLTGECRKISHFTKRQDKFQTGAIETEGVTSIFRQLLSIFYREIKLQRTLDSLEYIAESCIQPAVRTISVGRVGFWEDAGDVVHYS